jgi:hypothetical protein
LVWQLVQEAFEDLTFFSVPVTLKAEIKAVSFRLPHFGHLRFFLSAWLSIKTSKAFPQPVHLYSFIGICYIIIKLSFMSILTLDFPEA